MARCNQRWAFADAWRLLDAAGASFMQTMVVSDQLTSTIYLDYRSILLASLISSLLIIW